MKKGYCVNCKHLISDGPIWYSNYCKKSEYPMAVDPFDGKKKYNHANDLGTQIYSDQQYRYCRDVLAIWADEEGCIHFEPKRTMARFISNIMGNDN